MSRVFCETWEQQGESPPAGNRSWVEHGFSRIRFVSGYGFSRIRFVSGHGFSRAVRPSKKIRASAPEHPVTPKVTSQNQLAQFPANSLFPSIHAAFIALQRQQPPPTVTIGRARPFLASASPT